MGRTQPRSWAKPAVCTSSKLTAIPNPKIASCGMMYWSSIKAGVSFLVEQSEAGSFDAGTDLLPVACCGVDSSRTARATTRPGIGISLIAAKLSGKSVCALLTQLRDSGCWYFDMSTALGQDVWCKLMTQASVQVGVPNLLFSIIATRSCPHNTLKPSIIWSQRLL